jgi:hypothetical protein
MLRLATAVVLLTAAQTAAKTATAPPPAAAAATSVNWLHQPSSAEMASCMTPLLSGGGVATINLQCKTGGEGRVSACKVTENTQAADPRYEAAALCAAKFFRIQTTDAAGQTVFGVAVDIPFRLEPPAQPKAE